MTTKAGSARVRGAGDITRLLKEMREGDPQAAEELWPHVYQELRRLASSKLAQERLGS